MKKILVTVTFMAALAVGGAATGHASVIPDEHSFAINEYCVTPDPRCSEALDICYTKGWLTDDTKELPEWQRWDIVKQCMESEVAARGGIIDLQKGVLFPEN